MLQTDDHDPQLRLSSGATEVWLIRHGDAVRGPEEVAPGSYDEQGLSVLGRRQASALASALQDIPFAAIYASPAPRAAQTAVILASGLGLSVQITPNVREVDLTGQRPVLADDLPPAERSAAIAGYLRWIEGQALAIGVWDTIIGPGTSRAVRERMLAAVDHLAANHPGQRIAIASHAGAINAYCAEVLGIARDFFFPIVNTAVTVVRVRGRQHLIVKLNDVSHLVRDGLQRSGQPQP